MDTVNEGSTMTVHAKFDGGTTTPATVHYRIVDLDNNRVVRDWTSVAAGASIDITIIASDNEIFNDGRKRKKRSERRVVAVAANMGQDAQVVQEKEYFVRNIRGFDS